MSKKHLIKLTLFAVVCILMCPIQVYSLEDDSSGSYSLNPGDAFVWHVYDESEINFLYKFIVNGFNQSAVHGEIELYFIEPDQTLCYEMCFQELIRNRTSLDKYSEHSKSETRIFARKKVECMQFVQEETKMWIDLQTGVILEQSNSHITIKLVSWEDLDLSLIAQKLKFQTSIRFGVTLAIGVTITSLFYLKSVYSNKKKQKKWISPLHPLNLNH